MTVYVCLDDRGGLLFNGRRLSRDAVQLADMAAEGPLCVDAFSEKLVASAGIPYTLAEETLTADCRFFLENRDPDAVLPLAERVVIYRWNRHYPADTVFPQQWLQCRTLQESREFAGSSHETITREVYTL